MYRLDPKVIEHLKALSQTLYEITAGLAEHGAHIEKIIKTAIPLNQGDLFEEFPTEVELLIEEQDRIYDPTTFIPLRGSNFAAANDLRAYLPDGEIMINGHCTKLIPTGTKYAIPVGYQINVYSRSGLALNGIVVNNAPGIIDADYRGSVGVILHNQNNEPFIVQSGDRIAQIELHKVEPLAFKIVTELSKTERGEGGFGHTGIK